MAWNKFGPRTAFALGKALQKHTGVAELIASENNFGDSGGLSLAFALCVNKSIGNLELQRCGLGPNAAIAARRCVEIESFNREIGSFGQSN